MTRKTKFIIVGVTILVAYAAGRYTTPAKVVTVTKEVEVEKKTAETDTDRNKHRETTTTEVQKPDGTKETTTKVVEDTLTNRQTKLTDDSVKTAEAKTETTYNASVLTLAVLAGLKTQDHFTPVYGLSASKEVLGPIGVGAFGFTDGVFGASLSLSF